MIADSILRCTVTRRRMFTGLGLVAAVYVVVLLATYSNVYVRTGGLRVHVNYTGAKQGVQPVVMVGTVVNHTALTQVLARRVHIFSAAIANYAIVLDPKRKHVFQNSPNYSTIVITGWEHRDTTGAAFSCCIWLNNGAIVNSSVRHKQYRSTKVKLRATLFRCPLTVPWADIKGLSLAPRTGQCSNETRVYLKPFVPPLKQIPGIAICNKVAYFSADPNILLEWLEIQKFLGVSKVLTYPYMLNKDAMKVLEYYSSIGFVDILKYDYPDKDVVKRAPGTKTKQYFSDESVTVYDCQERLRHYKYAAVLDKDEVILPANNAQQGSLLRYLDAELAKKPIAALKFKTQFHDLSHQAAWRAANSSSLIFACATNCTRPVIDRPKNIYMPLRVYPGSVTTHKAKAAAGFRLVTVQGAVTIHHYRKAMRKKHKRRLPFTKCEHIVPLANMVAESVNSVRRELKLL